MQQSSSYVMIFSTRAIDAATERKRNNMENCSFHVELPRAAVSLPVRSLSETQLQKY